MEYWSVNDVAEWISKSGFAAHAPRFKEQEITGETLIMADHDMLKDMGIVSIGQRIAILKAIQNTKLAFGISTEDDYNENVSTPITATFKENRKGKSPDDYMRLENMIRDRDIQIQRLSAELTKLNNEFNRLKEEISPVWSLIAEYKKFEQKSEAKKKSADGKSSKSTKSSSNSKSPLTPQSAPVKSTSKSPTSGSIISNSTTSTKKQDPNVGAIKVYGDKLLNREAASYKSFQVTLTDPCSKILPVALRKYNITDDWQNYALFIQFKGKERCLSFDECPLQLHNELKGNSEEYPVFILKHIKQVKSPATRNSNSRLSLLTDISTSNNFGTTDRTNKSHFSTSDREGSTLYAHSSRDVSVGLGPEDGLFADGVPSAVAIYEYRAQREDELDVAIGERFKIIGRETGWCVVERNGRRGWVPAGCLMENVEDETRENTETQVEANTSSAIEDNKPQRGVVLYDYQTQSANELNIKKGDNLIITKRYQHWVLAENNGLRGWVPLCYVSMVKDEPSEFTALASELYSQTEALMRQPTPKFPENADLSIVESSGEEDSWQRLLRTVRSRPGAPNGSGTGTAMLKLDSLLDDINPYLSDEGRLSTTALKKNTSSPSELVSEYLIDLQMMLKALQLRIEKVNGSQSEYTRISTSIQDQIRYCFKLSSRVIENLTSLGESVGKVSNILEETMEFEQERQVTLRSTSDSDAKIIITKSVESLYSVLIKIGEIMFPGETFETFAEIPTTPSAATTILFPNQQVRSSPSISNITSPSRSFGDDSQRTLELQKELKARMKSVGRRGDEGSGSTTTSPERGEKTKFFVYNPIPYEELVTRVGDPSLDANNLEVRKMICWCGEWC
ncbi:Adaptor for signal transduction [Nowakowskiella sp. JEL0407]|nr:Adaptor for signal transduction [Nowakowskiella sp. JEL0407]